MKSYVGPTTSRPSGRVHDAMEADGAAATLQAAQAEADHRADGSSKKEGGSSLNLLSCSLHQCQNGMHHGFAPHDAW